MNPLPFGDPRAAVLRLLDAYADDPVEAELFRSFVSLHSDCAERSLLSGHLTGSAWLVHQDGERALLVHHRKLGRWLQPGGHADGDLDLAAVALREAQEETGLSGLTVEPRLFDIDRHWIPQRLAEPAHWHYDLRFVVHAGADDRYHVGPESHDLAWVEIAEIVADEGRDPSVRRMAQKWLAARSA